MALLLITLLATESLTETEEWTADVMNLESTGKRLRCPITGKKTFSAAVAAILASEELAKQIDYIEVGRCKAMNVGVAGGAWGVGAWISKKYERESSPGMVRYTAAPDGFSEFGLGRSLSSKFQGFEGLTSQFLLRLPFDKIAHALKSESEK
jgi:hypothetical protein